MTDSRPPMAPAPEGPSAEPVSSSPPPEPVQARPPASVVPQQAASGARPVKRTERPHPLTPFIRGWIVLVALVLGFGRQLLPNGENGNDWRSLNLRLIVLGVLAAAVVAALVGLVSWYFTRFVIDADELRVETGAIFKTSKRISFERLQSVDIVQPFAARLFGLAELRLEVGAGHGTTRLRYLSRSTATALRDYLISRAHGDRASVVPDRSTPTASALTDLGRHDRALVTVSPQRLVGAFLLSSEWLTSAGLVLVALILTVAFHVSLYALPGLIPLALGAFGLISRRVIAQFNFTLAETSRGLRVTRGLTNLTSQSVPVDRIQGLKIMQPLLWRALGWYRVDVDVLGYGAHGDESRNTQVSPVLLPVADAGEVRLALTRVLPGVDLDSVPLHPSPRRTALLRPFDFWTLRYGWDSAVVVTARGWLTAVREIVPHAKTQSVRIQQGPLQRLLRLADVHVDTARGPVNARAAHLNPTAARELALGQLDWARDARRRAWLAKQPEQAAARSEREVLERFGIAGALPLGEGGESRVFALGDAHVLRLYSPWHEAAAQVGAQLQQLYAGWTGIDLGFALPQVVDVGSLAGRSWTVDRRMSGQVFSRWLLEHGEAERRAALDSYLWGTWQLQRLPLPRPGFGRLLGEAPGWFGSLAELLDDQLQMALERNSGRLAQDVPDLDTVLRRLRDQIAERRVVAPAFVHGDVCPPNAYVGTGPDGRPRLTGIGDFSPHTLAADPLIDVAAAVGFLELDRYPEAYADAAWLAALAEQRIGPGTGYWIGVYRRYFAVYYSDSWAYAPDIYAWCLHQLRAEPVSALSL